MPSPNLKPGLLSGKTLLYIGHKLFLTSESDISSSCWATLRECGVRSIHMVLESSEENTFWANRLSELGFIGEFNIDGLVQEMGDDRPLEETVNAVIEWIETKHLEVDVCFSVSDYLRLVQASVSEALNLPSDSVKSIETVFVKDKIQDAVLGSSNATQHGVKSHAVSNEEDLVAVLETQTYPVIMKPICGEGSIGCKLLFDEHECRRHLMDLKQDMQLGGDTSEKFTYKNEVIVMEYLRGTKYSIDVAICRGDLIGGVIIEKGPPILPLFHATTVSMPGKLSFDYQQQLIRAAYDCCIAVGLQNGVYDVDMAWQDGGVPKLIEINPRPGGQGIKDLVEKVYGLDLFFINALLCCGIVLSASDFNFVPKGYAAAQLYYFKRHHQILRTSFNKMKASRATSDIMLISPGTKSTEDYLKETSNAYPLPILVIGAHHKRSTENAFEKLTAFVSDNLQPHNGDIMNLIT